jgi:hypothetical protein
MIVHLTPVEMPVVWMAFAAGIAIGWFASALWRRARSARPG